MRLTVSNYNKVKDTYERLVQEIGREPLVEETITECSIFQGVDFQVAEEFVESAIQLMEEDFNEEDCDDFEIGIKQYTFNNTLRKARIKAGLTQSILSIRLGMHTQRIGAIESLRAIPYDSEAEKIANFFDVNVEYMFPDWLIILVKKRQCFILDERIFKARDIRIDSGKALEIEGNYDVIKDGVDSKIDFDIIIDKIKSRCNGREMKVLGYRFGVGEKLSGESFERGCHTLEETAKEFGVTRERIRQIETKAMGKIREKLRSKVIHR